jgi:hypothetical protein
MFKPMKKRNYCRQQVLVVSLLVMLSACGGQAPKENLQAKEAVEVTESGNYFAGAQPIYADLFGNKDGSWTFRTITASDEPSDGGYLVRLNDLTAAFDTRIAECTTQVYPESPTAQLRSGPAAKSQTSATTTKRRLMKRPSIRQLTKPCRIRISIIVN